MRWWMNDFATYVRYEQQDNNRDGCSSWPKIGQQGSLGAHPRQYAVILRAIILFSAP